MPVVGTASGATGSVVIRNSERSLTNPRSAMTATGRLAVKVNVPSIALPPLKGSFVQESCDLFPGPQREGAVSGVDAVAVGEEEGDRGGRVVGVGQGEAGSDRPVGLGKDPSLKNGGHRRDAGFRDENPVDREPNMASPAGGVIPASVSTCPYPTRSSGDVPWEVKEIPPRSGTENGSTAAGPANVQPFAWLGPSARAFLVARPHLHLIERGRLEPRQGGGPSGPFVRRIDEEPARSFPVLHVIIGNGRAGIFRFGPFHRQAGIERERHTRRDPAPPDSPCPRR